MTSYQTILTEVFGWAPGAITLEDANGETFTSDDLDAVAAAADKMEDPWVDLVDSTGHATGLFQAGDPTITSPAPSFPVDGGMVYLLDGEGPLPDQPQGKNLVPLSALADFRDMPFYLPQDLNIATPSTGMEITLSQGKRRDEKQGNWKPTKSTIGQFFDFLQVHQEGQKDGSCFLQGESAGGARKAAAMMENSILGVDLDSGMPITSVIDIVTRHRLECLIYTTHSHLKNTSVIKRDAYYKWADETDVTEELVREYLITKKGVLPEIVEELTIVNDAQHTEEGVVILVSHRPMPKFRAIFPLSEKFIFAKRGGTQQDAIAEWKERYAGFCTELGLFFDEKCVDPARLFYFPRHKKGDEFGTWHVTGHALNLDDYDRVKMRRGRDGKRSAVGASDNAFTAAAGGSSYGDDDPQRYVTATGYNLRGWAGKYAKRLEIETLLQDLVPDMIREGRGSKAGVHISCPFEDEHTNFGGGGSFIVNASDALEDGFDKGFAMVCTHNACSGRDRLDFLKGLIDNGDITEEDITNRDYLMEVDDEIDEDDQDDRSARERLSSALASRGRQPANDEDVMVSADVGGAGGSADDVDFGDTESSMMRAFNKRYAVIVTSGGVKVLKEPANDGSEDDDVKFLTQNDVALLERTRFFFRSDGGGKTTKVEGFKAWLEWEKRRTYSGVLFSPGKPTPPNVYNLFRGFPYMPKQGDWSLLREHVYENICGSDDERFQWLMTWLAHIIQQPDKKPGSCIVITGEKGCGKSTLFDFMNRILGRCGITVAQRKQIVGQFNGHLATTLLMVCEEAFWAADNQAEGVIKDLITGQALLIERKGYDPVQSVNFTRMAMLSNASWVVPASFGDERRFLVLNCSSARRGDLEFFGALREQMENGGIEAMYHDLLHWKPYKGSWSVLFTPPMTEGLQRQQVESLSGVEKFMLELVKAGVYETDNDNLPAIELNEDDETIIPAVTMRSAVMDYTKYRFASDKAKTSYDDITEVITDWFGAKEKRVVADGGSNKRRVFIFPPLSEVRATLKEKKGLDIIAMPEDDLRKIKIR